MPHTQEDLFRPSPRPGETLSVSELTSRIRRTLETTFRLFRVEGEISNYKLHATSGHRYFCLKDDGAQIQVVLFRGRDQRVHGEIRNGQSVIVTGFLGVYEKRGEYQIYAQSVEVRGTGNLLAELERRKSRLAEEGLFDSGRKRPLPFFPRRIGIVTSRSGAAIRDMVRVARSRYQGIEIAFAPALVQGPGASADIAAALDALYQHGRADVIIAGRGGGSIEDLWAFNEEEVVRALARSPVPTISAVGHETDFTLSDLVADLRAPTPTGAAQIAVPDRVEFSGRIAVFSLRLRRAETNLRETARRDWRIAVGTLSDPRPVLERKRYALAAQERSLAEYVKDKVRERRERAGKLVSSVRTHAPAAWVSSRRGEAAVLRSRMEGKVGARKRSLRARLDLLSEKLAALDPKAVLLRGYSIALDRATGKAVRLVSEARPGAVLDIQVSDGSFGATVERKKDVI